MKRIWKLLLVIASMFVIWMHTMAPAYINYDFNVDGIYYAIIDKSTVMVCVPSASHSGLFTANISSD